MELPITVVVPTYNRLESLRRTLAGLARQDIDPTLFEVVVVSDGSTDGTDAWLQGAIADYPFRLRPIRQENSGPATARNRGIDEACGDIVVFVDDDVEPTPGLLEAHWRHHRENPAVAVIGPQSPDPARRRHETPWVVWEHEQLVSQYRKFADGTWKSAGPNHFYTGNASVRREHLKAVGGFDATFGRQEDVELAIRLLRDRRVRMRFDASADAVHRPSRAFASWLRTPYAYGSLDVKRANDGNLAWRVIWMSYAGRNRPTRRAIDIILPRPWLGALVHRFGGPLADMLWRMPMVPDAAPLVLLSMVYNVRYAEGARDAMGGYTAYKDLVRRPESEFLKPQAGALPREPETAGSVSGH